MLPSARCQLLYHGALGNDLGFNRCPKIGFDPINGNIGHPGYSLMIVTNQLVRDRATQGIASCNGASVRLI
jgi:hypothetical protein